MERTFFDWIFYIIKVYWPQFLTGMGITLFISLISTLVGSFIGLGIGVFKTMPKAQNKFKQWAHHVFSLILTAYVEFFRGTPMMVQAIIFYYGIQEFLSISFSPLTAGLIIVSINTGAYMAEVFRGGINSVDPGQAEATKAIGMTHAQTLGYVVIPQVIRNVLPSIVNELITNIKDTAVLNVISVTELFFFTNSIKGSTFRVYETFIVSAFIYLVMTFTFTRILKRVEKRLNSGKSSKVSSIPKGATK